MSAGKLMTSEELAAIRDAAEAGASKGDWDKKTILGLARHVDALQAQLDAAKERHQLHVSVLEQALCQIALELSTAPRLLAHLQARLIITDAGATRLWVGLNRIAERGCDGWGIHTAACECDRCIADDTLQSAPFHDAQRDLCAENERLLRLLQHLLPDVRARRDHACATCVPNGPIVLPGFICRYHTAVVAIEGRTIPETGGAR